MEFVMNELGVLGDHFGLVIIGCAELAIAAVYAGILLSRRTKNIRTKLALRDVEQKFLEEFSGKSWRWRARNRFFWKNLRTGRTSAVSSWKIRTGCLCMQQEIWKA